MLSVSLKHFSLCYLTKVFTFKRNACFQLHVIELLAKLEKIKWSQCIEINKVGHNIPILRPCLLIYNYSLTFFFFYLLPLFFLENYLYSMCLIHLLQIWHDLSLNFYICYIVAYKNTLLLIGKNSDGSGFHLSLSEWSFAKCHVTVKQMCWVCH